MPDTVRKVLYFTAEVADRSGEAARVLSGLRESGVNLSAFCGFPLPDGKAQLDFLPEDPDAFSRAAPQLDIEISGRKNAFLLQGEDRVGATAEILGKLASQGISVVGSQATAAGSGRWGMVVWVQPGDYDRASRALGV